MGRILSIEQVLSCSTSRFHEIVVDEVVNITTEFLIEVCTNFEVERLYGETFC